MLKKVKVSSEQIFLMLIFIALNFCNAWKDAN